MVAWVVNGVRSMDPNLRRTFRTVAVACDSMAPVADPVVPTRNSLLDDILHWYRCIDIRDGPPNAMTVIEHPHASPGSPCI